MRHAKHWRQPCPKTQCAQDNLMKTRHVSAIATYLTQSGQRRMFRCRTCATTCAATRDTVLFNLRTAAEQVMMALKRRLVQVDLAGISFVLGVTAEPVWGWLARAAPHAEASNAQVLRDLPVTQGHLDARWNVIERQHARETDAAGASVPEGADGRQGVWVSCAPDLRLMSAAVVGPRPLDTAKAVVAVPKGRVAGIPACFSDGFTGSLAARIAACPVVTTFARTGQRGRPRQPVWEPHPALVDGPLVKPKKPGKWLTRSTRVVLGAERLTHLGLTISTAVVERVHLTLRQALAPLARQTSSFCTDRERRRQRVVFFPAFYNVARPHLSLRRPLPMCARTRQGAIRPRWRERTPAMAAGLTDHVWTVRELLTVKCEPLDSQSIGG